MQFEKKNVSLADFKGKWLILDFWNEYCTGCIKSMPKLNEIQNEFKSEVQVLMVGVPYAKTPNSINTLYEKLRDRYNLNFAVTFDSKLFNEFNGESFPYIIIIDPDGIIRAKTIFVGKELIQNLLLGKQNDLNLYNIESEERNLSEAHHSDLIESHIQNNILYQSTLKVAEENESKSYNISFGKGNIQAFGFDIRSLYKIAFLGTKDIIDFSNLDIYENTYCDLIIELRDSSLFVKDSIFGNGYPQSYTYSLFSSNDSSDFNPLINSNFGKRMQDDLKSYFNYNARIEKRLMPYYRFIIVDSVKVNKLKTSRNEYSFNWSRGYLQGFKAENYPVQYLANMIGSTPDYPVHYPIVNETGIDFNIDISIESTFFEGYIKELDQHGFGLVKGEKLLNVLVISEH